MVAMDDLTAVATRDGTILLTLYAEPDPPTRAELSIELAKKLKSQIEAALVTAQVRASNLGRGRP